MYSLMYTNNYMCHGSLLSGAIDVIIIHVYCLYDVFGHFISGCSAQQDLYSYAVCVCVVG